MENGRGRRVAWVLGLGLALGGCLPNYSGGDPQLAGAPADPGGADGGTQAAADPVPDPVPDPVVLPDLGSPPADLAPASDLAVLCDKLQPAGGGQHNAGQDCQACHGAGGGAPRFTMGGTLYSALTGGAAVTGATINVTDAAGKTLKLVSADNGNFWSTATLTFPLKVDASLCPTTRPMSATAAGNCNSCHNSTFRVHVP